jgi:hypothetical protein
MLAAPRPRTRRLRSPTCRLRSRARHPRSCTRRFALVLAVLTLVLAASARVLATSALVYATPAFFRTDAALPPPLTISADGPLRRRMHIFCMVPRPRSRSSCCMSSPLGDACTRPCVSLETALAHGGGGAHGFHICGSGSLEMTSGCNGLAVSTPPC